MLEKYFLFFENESELNKHEEDKIVKMIDYTEETYNLAHQNLSDGQPEQEIDFSNEEEHEELDNVINKVFQVPNYQKQLHNADFRNPIAKQNKMNSGKAIYDNYVKNLKLNGHSHKQAVKMYKDKKRVIRMSGGNLLDPQEWIDSVSNIASMVGNTLYDIGKVAIPIASIL